MRNGNKNDKYGLKRSFCHTKKIFNFFNLADMLHTWAWGVGKHEVC